MAQSGITVSFKPLGDYCRIAALFNLCPTDNAVALTHPPVSASLSEMTRGGLRVRL